MPPHSPPGQLLHPVAGAGVKIVVTGMIHIDIMGTSKAFSMVLEGPPWAVELGAEVMLKERPSMSLLYRSNMSKG